MRGRRYVHHRDRHRDGRRQQPELPLDDAGLIQGISQNYFSGEPVSRSDAREVAANWEPWRTVATWYLWRSLDPVSPSGAAPGTVE